MKYSYLADGRKISSLTEGGIGLVYRGPFVYRRDASGALTFESASYEGGRLEPDAAYRYMTDHLGSTRAVARMDSYGVGDVVDYSSYGEKARVSGTSQTRLYFTDKEDQSVDFGLPYTDFGARHYSAVLHRWLVPDPLCQDTPTVSAYAYCAGDPVNFVDDFGDSLRVFDRATIDAIKHGFINDVDLRFNNGVLDPSSIPTNTSDWFLDDLYEIASSEQMVELWVAHSYQHKDEYGNVSTSVFDETPEDDNTKDWGKAYEEIVASQGGSLGKSINGNLGRTIVPLISESMSISGNVEVIINAKGTLNHRTVGIAHEFGHVLLYLRGLPHKHKGPGVDDFINHRITLMSRRLGYDF